MTHARTRLERGRNVLAPALSLIHQGRAPTRAALTEALGVTRATAGAVVTELAALGLIRVETGDSAATAAAARTGRPSHRVSVDPDGPVAVAAQVHADGTQVALVGLGGRIVALASSPEVPDDPGRALAAIAATAAHLLASSGRACVGAGLAVPSSVVEPEGAALNPLYLGWPPRVPVRDMFTEELRRAGIAAGGCFAANDINLAALAEYRHGAGRGATNLLVVATGHRGVGGALIVDGRPYQGGSNLGMEVGHLTVNPGGAPCHCGNRGCLDVESDATRFLRAARRSPEIGVPLHEQAEALLRDYAVDDVVRAAADTVIDRLGLGLAGLINIVDPDRILLGGLHQRLLEVAPDRLVAVVATHSLWAGGAGSVPLLACSLRHNSLIGAAELAWQPVLDDPLTLA